MWNIRWTSLIDINTLGINTNKISNQTIYDPTNISSIFINTYFTNIHIKYRQIMIIIKRLVHYSLCKSNTIHPQFIKFAINQSQFFSTISSNKKLKDLHSSLIKQASTLNASTLIRSLHILTFKYEADKQIVNHNQLQFLLNKILSLSIVSITHADLTLLLELLSEYASHQKFNINSPIYKHIYKRLNNFASFKLDSNYVYRLLHILDKLNFPSRVIEKYLKYLTRVFANINSKDTIKLNAIDHMRIFIIMIEKKYCSLYSIISYFDVVSKMQYDSGYQLAYLYYMRTTLGDSLKVKQRYIEGKMDLHEVISNPYSSLATDNGQEEEGQMQKIKRKQKEKIDEMIQNLIEQISNKYDVEKIEEKLAKCYDFEHEPLTPAIMILTLTAKPLHKRFLEELKKQYTNMLPFQYIKISQGICKQENREQLIEIHQKYCNKIWEYAGVGDKLKLLEHGARIKSAKQPLETSQNYLTLNQSTVAQCLKAAKSINEEQFEVLQYMMKKHIKQTQYQQILRMVETIIEKNP